jgi:hypothetical protein
MIYGKTDLKPFRKLSYCEFDCNWDNNPSLTNVWKGSMEMKEEKEGAT